MFSFDQQAWANIQITICVFIFIRIFGHYSYPNQIPKVGLICIGFVKRVTNSNKLIKPNKNEYYQIVLNSVKYDQIILKKLNLFM